MHLCLFCCGDWQKVGTELSAVSLLCLCLYVLVVAGCMFSCQPPLLTSITLIQWWTSPQKQQLRYLVDFTQVSRRKSVRLFPAENHDSIVYVIF